MRKLLQQLSFLIFLLIAGANDLWSMDIHKTGRINKAITDTLPPLQGPTEEKKFKKQFQYDMEGKITHIETEDQHIKIEYDPGCNKQSKSTRISKAIGDSVVYNFTYDKACQLAMGTSSDGINLRFEFDAKQRLIAIIQSSKRINITYNNAGLPQKVSLGNRDYVQNLYDSLGRPISPMSESWWHPVVGSYRILKLMYQMIKDTETLFNRLVKFTPGLNMAEISDIFRRYAIRPPFSNLGN